MLTGARLHRLYHVLKVRGRIGAAVWAVERRKREAYRYPVGV